MRKRSSVVTALVGAMLVAVLVPVVTSPAGATPEGFEVTNVITGLNRPTNLEFSPDGRVFVAEQGGQLKVFDGIDDTTATIAYDMRAQVHAVNGRGFLGLALDPDFPTTPHAYVMYTHDAPIGGTAPTWGTQTGLNDECPVPPGPGECITSGRISRLVLDGDVVTDEIVILEDYCAEWTSHSVGDLRFGPEGALYATAGDGAFAGQPDWGQKSGLNACGDPPIPHGGEDQPPGNAEGGALRSQDLRTSGDPAGLNGTVIRIDKNTGAAWPDNPNFGHPDPNVARIIAFGLRNPYRTTFLPGTDDLFVGDVGWNDWEEINLVPDPDDEVPNYGWPCYEGRDLGYDVGIGLCDDLVAEGPSAVEFAYYEYEQRVPIVEGDGCLNSNGSPSALTFYEGGAYPAAYDGAFFFGDYSRRCVWSMFAGPDGLPDPTTVQLITTDIAVTDLETGPQGDVFALNIFGGGGLGGTVVRISFPGGLAEPTARLSVAPTTGPTPLAVTLDASASTPGVPGDVLTFDWDLDGDGNFGDASGSIVNTVYNDEAQFTAQVRVTDQNGESDVASQLMQVGTPPTVTISQPLGSTTWKVDDEIPYAGSATDADGNPLPAENLFWDLILHHCEALDDCHTHTIGTVDGVMSGSFFAPEHEYPSFIEVALTATGPNGLQSTTSVELFPETAQITLNTEPEGLELRFNGKPVTSPFTADVIVGSVNSIGALSERPYENGAVTYNSWSDGGAQTHDVVVTDDVSFTAFHDFIPEPTILLDDIVIQEQTGSRTTIQVPIRLSSPSEDIVRVRADLSGGTARFGSDLIRWPDPKTVRFNPGETLQTVPVVIQNDAIDELDETFFIDFWNPVNAPLPDDQLEATIVDDDPPPRLTILDKIVTEGTGTGTKTASVTVKLAGRSDRPVTVRVTSQDGTATAPDDYLAVDQVVTFNPGVATRTVPVRIVRDAAAEGNETFELVLSEPTNATITDDTGVFTIGDDEPTASVADVTVTEGATGQRNMTFRVKLNKTARETVTIDWTTVDGTATSPDDYIGASGTVTIPKGSSSKTVVVKVNGDRDPEPTEQFEFVLSNASGATIADDTAIGTIRSDDYQPTINIFDAQKTEAGTSVKVIIRLDERATTSVKVKYTTVDGTATAPDDYTHVGPKTVTFTAGSIQRAIYIKIKHDRLIEGDETIQVVLSDPLNGTIGDGVGIITIIDND